MTTNSTSVAASATVTACHRTLASPTRLRRLSRFGRYSEDLLGWAYRTALRSFIKSVLYHRLLGNSRAVLQTNLRLYDRAVLFTERISYWLCRPAALELGRSQDGRNAVRLRR